MLSSLSLSPSSIDVSAQNGAHSLAYVRGAMRDKRPTTQREAKDGDEAKTQSGFPQISSCHRKRRCETNGKSVENTSSEAEGALFTSRSLNDGYKKEGFICVSISRWWTANTEGIG